MSVVDHEDARALLGGARRVRTRVRGFAPNLPDVGLPSARPGFTRANRWRHSTARRGAVGHVAVRRRGDRDGAGCYGRMRNAASAGLSAGGIRALVLPPEARMVTLCADNSNTVGQHAAAAAAWRWLTEDRRVRIAMPPDSQHRYGGRAGRGRGRLSGRAT